MFVRLPTLLAAALLTLTACTPAPPPALPSRVLLFYDFSGAWAATAGDDCRRQIDLSDGVFVSIAPDPAGDRDRFYVDGFFMLEPGASAEALPGQVGGDGALELTVESVSDIAGRPAVVAYRLTLEPKDPHHVVVTSFVRSVRLVDGSGYGRTESLELLADRDLAAGIPVLASAGVDGLCLRRI